MKVIVITGPTASGKTDLAIALAKKFNGELISADSRQVYKFLDIGTAKDKSFPHHMIDVVDPRSEKMTVADYQKRVYQILNDIHQRGKLPIIVGGSGLYIDAVLKGYEFPTGKTRRGQFVGRLKPPPYRFLILGIKIQRTQLYRKIDARVVKRLGQGMIEEVKKLRQLGVSDHKLDGFGLEYRYILKYLEGHLTRPAMVKRLKNAIHTFARHQYNWFKRWPVVWVEPLGLGNQWKLSSRDEKFVAQWLAA